MPLTMRPTGLGAGIDKDGPDYTIYSRAVTGRAGLLVLVPTRRFPKHVQ
jgi:hypothetical protein